MNIKKRVRQLKTRIAAASTGSMVVKSSKETGHTTVIYDTPKGIEATLPA